MQTDGKQTLDDSLIIDSNGCIEYVRFDSAVAQAPDVQTEQPNEMCVAEEKSWALENMETVSLELDDDSKSPEGMIIIDTVAFEQEAELIEKEYPYDITSTYQNYFKNPNVPEDFSIIVENNCGASENLTSSQFPSLGNSAMLASYYVEPALEADKTSPNVISNMSDITLAVSNLNLDKSNLSAESSESTAIESSLSTVAGTERKSVQSNSDKDPKIVDSKENITEDTQELSRFFKEEKFGTDKLGKAFFDALAQTIPVSTSSGLSGDGSVFDYFNPLNTHAVFSEDTKSYDYWIATPSTKQQLATLASSPIGTYFPEKEHLTMPGVIITEDLRDPIRDLTRQYLGEDIVTQRIMLTADNVSQDEGGLLKLISVGCFRAAVNLTTRLLTLHGQGLKKSGHPSRHSPQSLQIWMTRLALLLKLRLFNMAEAESEPFGDLNKPDLYYEFYPEVYGNRKGCMVPFAFRILLAQILTCVGKYGDSLDRLYVVLDVVSQIIKNLENEVDEDGNSVIFTSERKDTLLTLWRRRELKVLYTIANCLIAQNDFSSAFSVLENILKRRPEDLAKVRSSQGHILLHLGDVKSAQISFDLATAARSETTEDNVASLVDRALMVIANSNFSEAYKILTDAQILQPENPVVINNMAVCLLYMGKLREAFHLLENAIARNPKMYVHECVLVNICTLYDLESSRSWQKKSSMLEIVNRHAGDGFNAFCLKLQNAP